MSFLACSIVQINTIKYGYIWQYPGILDACVSGLLRLDLQQQADAFVDEAAAAEATA